MHLPACFISSIVAAQCPSRAVMWRYHRSSLRTSCDWLGPCCETIFISYCLPRKVASYKLRTQTAKRWELHRLDILTPALISFPALCLESWTVLPTLDLEQLCVCNLFLEHENVYCIWSTIQSVLLFYFSYYCHLLFMCVSNCKFMMLSWLEVESQCLYWALIIDLALSGREHPQKCVSVFKKLIIS